MSPPAAGAGWREHRGGLAVCLALAAALGLAAALLHLARANTLANSGLWVSTKTGLEKVLLGARSFYEGRQALAGGALDLEAWHGYQEVWLGRPVELEALELSFQLDNGAYLAVLFELGPGREAGGVRLTRSRHFPTLAFTVDGEGAFLGRRDLPVPQIPDDGWHRLRLEPAGEGTRLLVDGAEAARLALRPDGPGRVGFRGGFRGARVDDVRIETAGGGVIEDGFEAPAGAVRTAALWALGFAALCAVGLLAALARAGDKARPLLFAVATVELTLVVCALLLLPWVRSSAAAYPAEDPELRAQEEIWRREEVESVRRRLRQDYPPTPEPGTLRVLAVGTSQTWGAGASREEHVWVNRLERLLAEAAPEGTRVEVINAGVSAARSAHLAPLVESEWLALEPHLVLIDLGNNDRQAVPFDRNVRRIVGAARAAGARVALIPEPNSIERWGPHLAQRHEVLRAIGADLGVPVIEMQAHLRALNDSGFLWWDKVHLTSYGQRLFAEKVAADLVAAGLFVSPSASP